MAYRSSTRSETGDRDYTYRRGAVRDFDDDLSIDVSVRDRDRVDRTPAFLRDDMRRVEAGPVVLRSREVETVDRRRARSPSVPASVQYRRPRFVDRSPSPPPAPPMPMQMPRVQVVDRERLERRQQQRDRSPTPELERDLIRLRIERERKERTPSPSPSTPPPQMQQQQPQVIRGPVIEREVITHYRDIDHGVVRAKPPTPPPAPAPVPAPRRGVSRRRERETDIDIDIGHNGAEIDIRQRSRSRSRPRERPRPLGRPSYDDDDILLVKNRESTLSVIDKQRRRAHSAAPRGDWTEEAEYITNKVDARGQMGEAKNGATRGWTIVDVPPGTERIRMDGIGGASTETTWQRYNGVRRSKFIPEREDSPAGTVLTDPAPDSSRERLSVQIMDSKHRDREREVIEVEDVRDRRVTVREDRRAKKREGMWTEITRDLVTREAIERIGYDYEETEYFFYIMHYLQYEDVLELVDLSDDIRRTRRRRAREADEYAYDRRHHRSHRRENFDEELVERDFAYDSAPRYYR
ncbi:hypothetical protein GGR50DRAFT_692704 [Xylaria sp. CBS 124048]|nr:hypothetical protein GGR50DRAFT_692704 [Xylaria sp. CBS 124048]